MANRKITCKNTECKHYKSGDICDTSITIGRSGKCESFEKGFIYYFQIVWRSLHRKNYVDEIEIMNNPDLKIGLFYVIECFDLGFSTLKWGSSRIYMLKDGTDGKALKAEEIVDREMDDDKFRKFYDDFENGILPDAILKKNDGKALKLELKEYGWLSPAGDFTPSPFGHHEESAEAICAKYDWTDDYWKWDELQNNANNSLTLRRDYLQMVKGYCLIHNPSGDGGYIVSYKMPLTEKQKDFLFKYFMDMGDTLTAEESPARCGAFLFLTNVFKKASIFL